MTPGTLATVRSLGIVPLFNKLEPYGEADRYLAHGDVVLVIGEIRQGKAWPVMALVVESGRVCWTYAEDLSEEGR